MLHVKGLEVVDCAKHWKAIGLSNKQQLPISYWAHVLVYIFFDGASHRSWASTNLRRIVSPHSHTFHLLIPFGIDVAIAICRSFSGLWYFHAFCLGANCMFASCQSRFHEKACTSIKPDYWRHGCSETIILCYSMIIDDSMGRRRSFNS